MLKKKRKQQTAIKLELRKIEKKKRQLTTAKEKLYRLEAGGNPDRPLAVPSVAVIETRAKSIPCCLCQSRLRVHEHSVEHRGKISLRKILGTCSRCNHKHEIWFRIVAECKN